MLHVGLKYSTTALHFDTLLSHRFDLVLFCCFHWFNALFLANLRHHSHRSKSHRCSTTDLDSKGSDSETQDRATGKQFGGNQRRNYVKLPTKPIQRDFFTRASSATIRQPVTDSSTAFSPDSSRDLETNLLSQQILSPGESALFSDIDTDSVSLPPDLSAKKPQTHSKRFSTAGISSSSRSHNHSERAVLSRRDPNVPSQRNRPSKYSHRHEREDSVDSDVLSGTEPDSNMTVTCSTAGSSSRKKQQKQRSGNNEKRRDRYSKQTTRKKKKPDDYDDRSRNAYADDEMVNPEDYSGSEDDDSVTLQAKKMMGCGQLQEMMQQLGNNHEEHAAYESGNNTGPALLLQDNNEMKREIENVTKTHLFRGCKFIRDNYDLDRATKFVFKKISISRGWSQQTLANYVKTYKDVVGKALNERRSYVQSELRKSAMKWCEGMQDSGSDEKDWIDFAALSEASAVHEQAATRSRKRGKDKETPQDDDDASVLADKGWRDLPKPELILKCATR